MYTLFIVLIIIASFLIILAVLAQNPKSGMAANFGASNAVMGVRQTADFLEKLTWGLSIAIVVLSLCATMAIPSGEITKSNDMLLNEIMQQQQQNSGTSPFEIPSTTTIGTETGDSTAK